MNTQPELALKKDSRYLEDEFADCPTQVLREESRT